MAPTSSQTVALIGIGVAFGVSLLTAFVSLLCYVRLKLKDDTNVRRRVIATAEAKAPILVQPEPEIIEEVVPLPPPIVYPEPILLPEPAPPPAQKFVVLEPHQPPPQPLPPPPEPEVVVHEVIHRYEPAPPPPPPPQQRVVRRMSWGGPQEDDWVLVKRVTKSSGNRKTRTSRNDSSEEDSSDEEDARRVKRRQKKRLDRYDLATNMVPIGLQPQGFMMGQPMMATAAPVMAQPVMAAQQAYMPFFSVPR